MVRTKRFKGCLVLILLLIIAVFLFHSRNDLNIKLERLGASTIRIPVNRSVNLVYKLINNSNETYTLSMISISGVMQQTGSKGQCGNPIVLFAESSCQLSLNIDANELTDQGLFLKPKLCKTMGEWDNSADLNKCFIAQKEAGFQIIKDTKFGEGTGKFLVLSDIHYNPLSTNTHYPNIAGDTNKGMLDQFIDTAVEASLHGGPPDFILILGDFLAHNIVPNLCDENCVRNSINYPMQKLWSSHHGALENIPIYSVLGNNDSYAGDYRILSTDGFFDDVGRIFGNYAYPNDPSAQSSFVHEFSSNFGSYIVTIPQTCKPGQPESCKQLIVLNTVPFANTQELECNGTNQGCEAFRQKIIDLINAQVSTQVPTFAAMHIPDAPTIPRVWDSSLSPQITTDTMLFSACTNSHPNCIQQILAGHMHFFGLNVETYPGPTSASVSTMIAPPATPFLNGEPGFLIVTYDRAKGNRTSIDWYTLPNYAGLLANKPFSIRMQFTHNGPL